MKHIEEHILEQYALNPDSDAITQSDGITKEYIEQHLAECHGCRETLERIRTFYTNLNTKLESISEESATSTQSIARIEEHIITKEHSDLQFYEELPMTFLGKVIYSAKRHPVAAGSSTIALIAFVAAFYLILTPAKMDTNPDNLAYDEDNNLVIIRNKEYEPLWKFPAQTVRDINMKYVFSSKPFLLSDIDNDGKKEFLASAPTVNDNNNSSKLNVYDDDNLLKFEYVPNSPVTFRERNYAERFFSHSVDVMTNMENGEKLIVLNSSNGRSPSILSVLNSSGEVLGEFYHFGNLSVMFRDTLTDGKEYLFLAGTCDVEEFEKKKYSSYAVFVVIDPSKIIGEIESSHTPGFGLPTSPGEIYYVRLPLSDIDLASDAFRAGALKASQSNNAIIIRAMSGDGSKSWDFDYTFDRNLVVQAVKASDGTYQTHESFKKSGKIVSTIDSTYLNNLKRRVEYWDGKRWQSNPTVIQHF
ncbi:MAG: hypothetical protein HYV29_14005 [Ignavibacteriales bacterium]|nr:hypothetical protein [Ignavibacteriales bacterium]